MKAWRIAAGISCCLTLASGCGMCQHPYYDCGPVWSRGTCLNCNPDYRAGSILNRQGPDPLAASDGLETDEPAAEPLKELPGDVQPAAPQGNPPQTTAEDPWKDFKDWRPAAVHLDPAEAAVPLRELDPK